MITCRTWIFIYYCCCCCCCCYYYYTTATATTNVRIIVLPSHSCGGTLQSLYLKLLYSSTQTSADGLNRMDSAKSAVWLTKRWDFVSLLNVKSEEQARVSGGRPCPRCSHRKGAVAHGSPTSRRRLQCRSVSRAETATSDDLCLPQAVRQVRRPVLCRAHNGTQNWRHVACFSDMWRRLNSDR